MICGYPDNQARKIPRPKPAFIGNANAGGRTPTPHDRRRKGAAGYPSGGSPHTPLEHAMHIDREQKSAKDMDLRSIDDRSTAQIVPIGEGKFGVIWNGELRPEKDET
jgi:hypothetical protein